MNKELQLECEVVTLKAKLRYYAGVVEEINTKLLQEQMKGNEEVKLARDKLRDLSDIMRSNSL